MLPDFRKLAHQLRAPPIALGALAWVVASGGWGLHAQSGEGRVPTSAECSSWSSATPAGTIDTTVQSFHTRHAPEESDPRILTCLVSTCSAGNGAACLALTGILREGQGTPVDESGALTAAQGACACGEPEGCAKAAAFLTDESASERDTDRGRELFELACTHGSVEGCKGYAAALHRGTGGDRNLDRAWEVYHAVCNTGDGAGCQGVKYMAQLSRQDTGRAPSRGAARGNRPEASLIGPPPAMTVDVDGCRKHAGLVSVRYPHARITDAMRAVESALKSPPRRKRDQASARPSSDWVQRCASARDSAADAACSAGLGEACKDNRLRSGTDELRAALNGLSMQLVLDGSPGPNTFLAAQQCVVTLAGVGAGNRAIERLLEKVETLGVGDLESLERCSRECFIDPPVAQHLLDIVGGRARVAMARDALAAVAQQARGITVALNDSGVVEAWVARRKAEYAVAGLTGPANAGEAESLKKELSGLWDEWLARAKSEGPNLVEGHLTTGERGLVARASAEAAFESAAHARGALRVLALLPPGADTARQQARARALLARATRIWPGGAPVVRVVAATSEPGASSVAPSSPLHWVVRVRKQVKRFGRPYDSELVLAGGEVVSIPLEGGVYRGVVTDRAGARGFVILDGISILESEDPRGLWLLPMNRPHTATPAPRGTNDGEDDEERLERPDPLKAAGLRRFSPPGQARHWQTKELLEEWRVFVGDCGPGDEPVVLWAGRWSAVANEDIWTPVLETLTLTDDRNMPVRSSYDQAIIDLAQTMVTAGVCTELK